MTSFARRLQNWIALRVVAPRFRQWLRWLPTLVVLGIYARNAQRFIRRSSFTLEGHRYYSLFDDGMISMRYAWNLVHGNGLVWNAGERVEGYTNPLWTMVMAVCIALFSKSGAVLAMQTLGAVLLGVGGVVYGRIGASFCTRSHWTIAAAVEAGVCWVVTSNFPLRFWTHMGMEVGALVVLGAFAWSLALRRPTFDRMLVVGVLMAIAYAVRPDGLLSLVPPLTLGLFTIRASAKQVLTALAPLAAAVVLVGGWRYAYYGEFVPNTYRLKMGLFPLRFRITNGIGFVEPYLEQTMRLWVLSLIVVAKRRDARSLALLCTPCLLLAYQVYVGGDPWSEWRQLAPAYPAFVLLSLMLVIEAANALRPMFRRLRPVTLLFPVATMLVLELGLSPTQAAFADRSKLQFNVDWNKANVQRALLLRRILKPGARMAVFWGGATPYYDTDHQAIDILGKCDAHVAARAPDLSGKIAWGGMTSVPGHNKSDIEYSVETRNADYTETFDWGNDRVSKKTEKEFGSYSIGGQGFALRKGSPNVDWSYVTSASDKPH